MGRLRALQARALTSYLECVRHTSKVEFHGSFDRSSVVAIWVEWIYVALVAAPERANIAVYVLEELVTPNILDVISQLGFRVIRARPDNLYGFREARDFLCKPGHQMVITADGPYGPAHETKRGVARIAQVAGVPISPLALSISHAFELPTWDRCIVPDAHNRIAAEVLGPISTEGSAVSVAASVTDALNGTKPRVSRTVVGPFGRAPSRLWAKACTHPLRFGALRALS